MFRDYIIGTGEENETALRAAGHIDLLTFNCIQDFTALTENQQSAVMRAYSELTEFETENADLLDVPMKAYSINGVSMSFGGDGIRTVSGVTVPADIYALLTSTGLCYRAI